MDASVDTLLPRAVDLTVITARVGVEGLRVGHRLVARAALVTDACGAVALTVRESSSAVVHEGVRGEHQLDLPVTICAVEELSLELTMKVNVLVLDEDAALVTHVTRGRARVLVIVAVVLDSQALSGCLPVAADRELLGVIAGPDLDLVDIAVRKTSSLHLVSKGLTVAVVALIAEKKVLFTSDQDFEVSHEVLGKVTTAKVGLNLEENGSKGLWLDVLSGIHAEA